ncbi:hypothetical protein [Sphingobacterium spiritivorum]|uniref:hypothetical protein n=1 Tax=Sphingobacterium spiritivorum TaxID=258 RepID=UPI001919EF72|nr:hypothetical protein [Sphingobacterium spiritivorum]QQT25839.1 hypothetical protein I6J02_19350 [Sphingobacterium spiritivorum]
MERTVEQPNGENQPAGKSKKGLYITLTILCLLILGAGGYYFAVYKNGGQSLDDSNAERQEAINSIFSVSEYDNIPDNYKAFIYNFLEYNNYLDGTEFLTKIADRAKSVYAFGNFTGDDDNEDDMAVLFEKNDYKSSSLVIFNHKGEGLLIKDYESELPVINSFKAGARIYMDEAKLVPAPCAGLIIKNENTKYALVYDKKTKKFNSYYQYTQQEIENMDQMGSEDDISGDTPEETESTPDSTHTIAEGDQ